MLLRQLWCESTIGYAGQLPIILGNGQDMTLNFGGAKGRPPFLFAPLPIAIVRRLRNKVSKCKVWPPQYGHQGIVDCTKRAYGQSKLGHIGEAHCTIEMYGMKHALEHLQKRYHTDDPIDALTQSGLFDRQGNGLKFPMKIKSSPDGGIDYLVVRSSFYADQWDSQESGLPVIVGAKLEAPLWEKVHEALGTEPYPTLPNGDTFVPHVTFGYMHSQAKRPTPEAERESPADIRQQIRRSYETADAPEKLPQA